LFKAPLTGGAIGWSVECMRYPESSSVRTVLIAVSLLAWLLLAWMALDMAHPLVQLTMPGGARWSASHLAAIFTMWAVMMAAMMLPSALPVVLAFVRLSVRQAEPGRASAFVAAYLLAWAAFSALATALQWWLQWLRWVDPMIASRSPTLDVVLLLVAGAYQFSPLKRTCLARCRTPLGFLIGGWRPGLGGAFAMGLRHGLFCLGCCWALMTLLFVGGVMNIAWVAALAVAVAIEKTAPGGERWARVLGLALIVAGLLKLLLAVR
jgi:predicted metal-binding membrane protein